MRKKKRQKERRAEVEVEVEVEAGGAGCQECGRGRARGRGRGCCGLKTQPFPGPASCRIVKGPLGASTIFFFFSATLYK